MIIHSAKKLGVRGFLDFKDPNPVSATQDKQANGIASHQNRTEARHPNSGKIIRIDQDTDSLTQNVELLDEDLFDQMSDSSSDD